MNILCDTVDYLVELSTPANTIPSNLLDDHNRQESESLIKQLHDLVASLASDTPVEERELRREHHHSPELAQALGWIHINKKGEDITEVDFQKILNVAAHYREDSLSEESKKIYARYQ